MKELNKNKPNFTFSKENYFLLIIGVIFIIVGLLFMQGGEMHDESNMSFNRITLAPILIILGFCINAFAILYTKKDK